MADVQVGPTLTDVVAKLSSIVATLEPAYRASQDANSKVNFESVYKGAALADMESFYKQYMDDLESLIYYYGLAKSYVIFIAEQFEQTDAQVAQSIDSQSNSQSVNSPSIY